MVHVCSVTQCGEKDHLPTAMPTLDDEMIEFTRHSVQALQQQQNGMLFEKCKLNYLVLHTEFQSLEGEIMTCNMFLRRSTQ